MYQQTYKLTTDKRSLASKHGQPAVRRVNLITNNNRHFKKPTMQTSCVQLVDNAGPPNFAVDEVWTNEFWKNEVVDVLGQGMFLNTSSKGYWTLKGVDSTKGKARTLAEVLTLAPQILINLAGQQSSNKSQLTAYKCIDNASAQAILDWDHNKRQATESEINNGTIPDAKSWHSLRKALVVDVIPLGGHIGGREQAAQYRDANPTNLKLLKFTLKKGAAEMLFSPDMLAIMPGAGGAAAQIHALVSKFSKEPPKIAAGGEGGLAGYIGVKSESKGPYSMTIGKNDATPLLFQLLIEKVEII